MGGGTLQLVIFGGQDIHLTGNPEFSYFKTVYRRHTNFSMECIEQNRIGTITTGDFSLNYVISKSGDLLNKMHFEIDLPSQAMTSSNSSGTNYCSYTNNTAYSYMKDVELFIGEKSIDKHDGKWYDIQNELNHDNNDGLDYLVNKHSAGVTGNTSPPNVKLYIPLQFWFTKGDVSLSLPLIALQYHDVKLKVNFRDIKKIINAKEDADEDDDDVLVTGNDRDNPQTPSIKLWSTYILLDVDERKRFAQSSHEYLIEQVQKVEKSYSPKIDISLNHPIKCLYWVIQNNVANTEKTDYKLIDNTKNTFGNDGLSESANRFKHGNDYLNFRPHEVVNPSYVKSLKQYEHFKEMTIMFNGIERFEHRDATYFRTIQPLEVGYTFPEKNIYIYSFCLKPEEIQPSGSCNFSRIDNLTFNFTGNQLYTGYTFNLYAKNYNILRIMGGMGGLLYSN